MRRRLAWITAVGWAAAAACAEPYDEWSKPDPPQPRLDSGAPKDAAVEIDAAPAYACERTAAFGAPTHISGGVNTADDERWASLTADERTLYFGRKAQGDAGIWDVFVARRTDRDAAFEAASPLASINTTQWVETSPTVSADEKTIFFASDRGDGGYRQIFMATRPNPSSDFGEATPVTELAGDSARPFLRFDGSELWFTSYRQVDSRPDGGLGMEIYRSSIIGGRFQPPGRVVELESEATEFDPVVSADGLDLFFASNRGGDGGVFRIWTAHRDSPLAGFASLHVVGELISPEGEFPAWISPDGCRLYFTSNREGGAGGADLWVAERRAR